MKKILELRIDEKLLADVKEMGAAEGCDLDKELANCIAAGIASRKRLTITQRKPFPALIPISSYRPDIPWRSIARNNL